MRNRRHSHAIALADEANVSVQWTAWPTLVNIRGDRHRPAFAASIENTLQLALPEPGQCHAGKSGQLLWLGPDSWLFVAHGGTGQHHEMVLQRSLAGVDSYSVTDVSNAWVLVNMAGDWRDILAQGCPLDLHPRQFAHGACRGSHFFKANIIVWQQTAGKSVDILARRSFDRYFQQALKQCCSELELHWHDVGSSEHAAMTDERTA